MLYTVMYAKEAYSHTAEAEQLRKLAKIAVREDVPVCWLIRKAIGEFLKRKK